LSQFFNTLPPPSPPNAHPFTQRAKLDFNIHTLPCIRFAAAVNDACFNFKLREGLSAETSGGLLAM
jgi:hypothetical protein